MDSPTLMSSTMDDSELMELYDSHSKMMIDFVHKDCIKKFTMDFFDDSE
jgi:hypothetical protein